MFWTYLDILCRFGRRVCGDDYLDIHLAVTQGTLLWQPAKFGRCSQRSPATTFTLCFGVRLAYRKSAFKRLNGNNPATSCTNFVNFRIIISEFTLLKHAIFAAIWPQFADDLHLGVPKRFGRSQFWFSRVIDNNFYTSCRNLVRFCPWPRSLRHKKLYSQHRKFLWGDFRYIQ